MRDVVFETERFLIRDFRDSDLERVILLWQDPVALQYMDPPLSSAEARAWLGRVIHHNRLRPRDVFNLTMVVPDEDEALGWVGYGPSNRKAGDGVFGVGYMLDRTQWGNGVMTEVLQGVVTHVQTLPMVTRLQAHCDRENLASARVLDKAGFSLTHQRVDPETDREFLHFAIDFA